MFSDKSNSNSPAESEAQVPQHVAIIMDGNGRWAKKRLLPRTAGHKFGVDAVKKIVEHSISRGVKALTLFAFSSENWNRPAAEVSGLLELFLITINREVNRLHKNGVRIRFLGDKASFPNKLQDCMNSAEGLTLDNTTLQLIIAVGYGGRWEIVQAAKQLAHDVSENGVSIESIDEAAFSKRMQLPDLAEPDLFIRTGGEKRISNFLMWQLAYTELYFTDTLWPSFNESEYDKAIAEFASRQRRFGLTPEQIEKGLSK